MDLLKIGLVLFSFIFVSHEESESDVCNIEKLTDQNDNHVYIFEVWGVGESECYKVRPLHRIENA